jgi:excisionase family DNA binding protein
MDRELPSVMTVDEVAAYLRIPRSSVYKLAQQGKIPCQKVGRHWRFRRERIDQWLDAAEAHQKSGASPERG